MARATRQQSRCCITVAVLMLGAYPMFRSFALHTAFCVLLLVASAYNGGQRYVKMTTRWLEKALEHELRAAKKSG